MKTDRTIWALLLSLCFVAIQATSAKAQKPTQSVDLKGRNGQHRFVLHLAKGSFRKSHHKFSGFRTENSDTRRVDGQLWYGLDGAFPGMGVDEFYTFNVLVDGKRWPIPSSLYSNCYEPGLSLSRNTSIWAWLSKDGKHLTVKMHGSDGAGSYGVLWQLRKNGRHSRKFWSMV